jgi:short-subunit dehydrogenase
MVAGGGVTVTALRPGPTPTGFEDAASLGDSRLFSLLKVARAEDVASYGYRALMKGKPVAIHGLRNKVLAIGVRLAPRSLAREVMYRIQGLRASHSGIRGSFVDRRGRLSGISSADWYPGIPALYS